MNHAIECKFCRRHMILVIDEEYAIGDPYKLFPYACCDRCADLRVRRRTIEDHIKRLCIGMAQAGKRLSGDQATKIYDAMTELTKRYAKLVADWYNMSGSWWEKEFPMLLMDKPDLWYQILGDYWRHFRQMNKIT